MADFVNFLEQLFGFRPGTIVRDGLQFDAECANPEGKNLGIGTAFDHGLKGLKVRQERSGVANGRRRFWLRRRWRWLRDHTKGVCFQSVGSKQKEAGERASDRGCPRVPV